MVRLLPDLLALIALGLLVTCAALIWVPAAFGVGGVGCALAAVALDRQQRRAAG